MVKYRNTLWSLIFLIGVINAQNIIEISNISVFPGDTNKSISVNLSNSDVVGGIDFSLTYDTSLINIREVVEGSRLPAGFSVGYNIVDDTLIVLIVSFSGDSITDGVGNILNITFDVLETATPGDSCVLSFTDAIISSPQGERLPDSLINGTIYILPYQNIGDSNGILRNFLAPTYIVWANEGVIIHGNFSCPDIKIFDGSGRKVIHWRVIQRDKCLNIKLSGSSGLYLLYIKDMNKYFVRKIVLVN